MFEYAFKKLFTAFAIVILLLVPNPLTSECSSGSSSVPPVYGGAGVGGPTSTADFWWTVNRDEILYGDKSFDIASHKDLIQQKNPEDIVKDKYDKKNRDSKLDDSKHVAKIVKQIKDLSLLLIYNGDFSVVIRKMAKAKLLCYSNAEFKLFFDVIVEEKKSKKAEDKNHRLGALVAVGVRKMVNSKDYLKEIVSNSRDKEEIAYASESLLEVASQEAIVLIKEKLKQKTIDHYLRSYLTLCLSEHLDDELTTMLKNQMNDRSVENGGRRTAMISLVMNKRLDGYEILQKVINGKLDVFMRYDAVRLLPFVANKKQAEEMLVELLSDETPEIRREAAFAIAQLNNPSYKEVLYKHLKKEKNAEALSGMSFAYSIYGGPSDESDWKGFMKKLYYKNVYSPLTYFSAVGLSISNIPKEKAMKLYVDTYKDNRQYESRKGLILAMGLLNTQDSADKLADILNDRRSSDLRQYAAYAIAYMKRESTIIPLAEACQEGDNLVRHAAVAAHGMYGPEILKYKPQNKKDPATRLPELKKISEKDRVDVVRLGAAFSYDILSGDYDTLQTVVELSKLNANNFPLRRVDSGLLLDKVNEFYPKYHKTFLGY